MAPNRVIVDLEDVTNTCFVVMPFHSLFGAEYERVIRPAIEDVGLKCERGDEIYTHQSIVQDIWKSVRQARIVVAELSGRNPNVMYEIGMAHAIGKPIVLLTREQEDVPFDLRALRYIYYDPNNPFWGQDLRLELTKVIRKVLDTPSLAGNLNGITVTVDLPQTPEGRLPQEAARIIDRDFSGTWIATWLSIKKQREHRAFLTIPPQQPRDLMASMTVSYVREGQPTVVEETLTGRAKGRQLSLTGVTYTYLERGSSISYSLDSFDLEISEDGKAMIGNAVLRHGLRHVVFTRLNNLASDALRSVGLPS
ncbi:MAG TPA: hypothetical protein VLL54_05445 [Pyrinomonadaceae bacterium]|nr:hypothetical protein [Pyrinomonadaceae bacterium]